MRTKCSDSKAATHALPLVVACSPRKGGNSDQAACAFAQGVRAGGGDCRIVYLREHTILPCKGCSACAATGHCVLAEDDDAAELFEAMMAAPFVFFASPIYFYHLPAMFKGFIDRGQQYYMQRLNKDNRMEKLLQRKAYVALCAGRPRGDRLFEGSLLTLKYFLAIFGYTLHAHYGFLGKDGPHDFSKDGEAVATMKALGVKAWADR